MAPAKASPEKNTRASFSFCILQMLLRVHPRVSFALICSTNDICQSVLHYRVLHLLFKSFCPSESGIICWMCVFPSSRPLVKAAIRIKPRAHREEGLVALICCSLREKSSSSALALVSEGHNILQWPASTCVPVSAFHPIFPMQLLNLVQANLAKV